VEGFVSALGDAFDALLGKIVWHPAIKPNQLAQWDALRWDLRSQIDLRETVALQCVVTLDRLAAWPEGDQVDSTFDEPHAAQLARQQLAALGITGPLKPIQDHDGEAEARIRGDGPGQAA
jgi:hypothetical protein